MQCWYQGIYPISKSGDEMDLSVNAGGLKLENPFIAASGTYGYGIEWEGLSNPDDFGAIVAKGIFLESRTGNPHPRLVETSCGLINSVGLEGPGLEAFKSQIIPQMRDLGVVCIANINGESVDEFAEIARSLQKEKTIAALEVNVSCPNLQDGGMAFGVDPKMVSEITSAVRKNFTGSVIVILTPNVTDIRIPAKAALDFGADALTVANTYTGMSIDVYKRTSRIGRDFGGYSGPAVKPITLKLVHQVHSEFGCDIFASGGIYNLFDCLEYFIAGARALMLGTVNFIDPSRIKKLKSELQDFLIDQNTTLDEIIGSYKSPS
jgi:dihydroorotate dehydrogenase (NAD+) catalytic subunit